MLEEGPWEVEDGTGIYKCNYIPTPIVPTPIGLYDLRAERTAKGREPMRVQHCPSKAMTYGPVEKLAKGDVFAWTNPASRQQIPVRVLEAYDDVVKVDFNHPLAEKTLRYWIKVESIVD